MGRFTYKFLASVFLMGTIDEISTNGLTDLARTGIFLTIAMLVSAYSD